MKTTTLLGDKPTFRKTDVPCLYRYKGNGVYYAPVKHRGKQKRASLQTHGKIVAKRKLADSQRDLGKIDLSQGRLTLRELCHRYLAAIVSQAKEMVNNKTVIVRCLPADLSAGADVHMSKIRPSDLQDWLASYKRWDKEKKEKIGLGYASHNHHVQVVKSIFASAVTDKAIAESPTN